MMNPSTGYAEVAEAVRAAQSAYAQAFDDGRSDDVADLFTSDGVVEIEGVGVYEGRETIRSTYANWEPRSPQRHLVSNMLLTEYADDTARATADVTLLQLVDSVWSIRMVARYDDVLRKEGGKWLFARRTSTFPATKDNT
jgi:uncharacterized protein (TIGR02246 family)